MSAKDKRKKLAEDILRTVEMAEDMFMLGSYEHHQALSAALVSRAAHIKYLLRFIAGKPQ